VCIVIDVLRASSTIVTVFERGCERVVCAANIAEARRLHERLPDHLLCGESGGLPPPGFDYGNSPAEFSRLDLAGKSVILATTNGTRVLATFADAPAVLVGCLLNRAAVAHAAVHIDGDLRADIAIVAAGDADGSEEDIAAGRAIAAAIEGRAVATDTEREVRESGHAQSLRRIGVGEDVDYCARLDLSTVVPVLHPDAGGLLVLRPLRPPSSEA